MGVLSKSKNVFFIAGCQRSGTTLLRLILESHTKIYCFDEKEGYKLLISGKFEQFQAEDAKTTIGFKIPRFSEQLLCETMSDMDYGEFPSFYQGSPVVFIVRDYRDVIRSMAQLTYPDGESWLKKYGQAILIYQAKHFKFKDEDRKIFSLIKRLNFPDHLVGALYWKYKTESIFDLIASDKPVCIISYEDIVFNPAVEIGRIINFLELSWENSLLHHYQLEHPELDERGLAIGGTNPKMPIHPNSVNSYVSFFSEQDLKDMYFLLQKTIERLSNLNIRFP